MRFSCFIRLIIYNLSTISVTFVYVTESEDCHGTLDVYLNLLIFIHTDNINGRIMCLIRDVYKVHESFVCMSRNLINVTVTHADT